LGGGKSCAFCSIHDIVRELCDFLCERATTYAATHALEGRIFKWIEVRAGGARYVFGRVDPDGLMIGGSFAGWPAGWLAS